MSGGRRHEPPLTQVDLTDNLNVVQARHELHHAVDFGGEPELAAWARKWGEAGLVVAGIASGESEDLNVHWILNQVGRLQTTSATLSMALRPEHPDLPALRSLAHDLHEALADLRINLEYGE